MKGRLRIAGLGWFLAGFLAATLLAAAFEARPAAAQETARDREDKVPDGLSQSESATRASKGMVPRPDRPDAAADDTASDEAAADDPLQNDALPPQDVDPAEEAYQRTLPGRRPIVSDGDLSDPAESRAPTDDARDPAEADEAADASDPGQWDTRTAEDISMFENPPAGFDPLLFQVEDINPVVTDRRPERLFRQEPYDPLGIRIGSFVLFPETEIDGLATSNVLRSPDAASDIAAEVRSQTRLVSNWSAHALELRTTSLLSFHDDYTTEDDRAWSAEARARLDVTRRTNVQGLVSHDERQESRSAIDAATTGPRATVTTDQAALTLNHRFNRLSLQLRGSVSDVGYATTSTEPASDRDVTTTEEAVRASWEFKPELALFSETEINQRAYQRVALADGIGRDSFGERYRVGVDFGAKGAVLRGEASIGYGRQDPNDSRLSDIEAFLFDANLAWRATELTSFLLTAATDIYDTNTALSAGVVSRQVAIEARHAFRRFFIMTAGLAYSMNDYDAVEINEHEWRPTLTAEYYASREITLFGRYQHAAWRSDQPDGDYDVDEVRLGVRVRQ